MAYLLSTLRNQSVTSIRGRALGIDKDEFIVGPKALRTQVEDVQTTDGSSLSPFGLTRILTSGSSQTAVHTLQAPVIGVQKRIHLTSTSTGCQIVRASGGALFQGASLTTVGSTVLNFVRQNANITLEAVTSALWLVSGALGLNVGASGTTIGSSDQWGVSFTTST